MNIKTWQERLKESDHTGNEYAKGIPPHMTPPSVFYMQAEIKELRAALQERDAEIERLKRLSQGAGTLRRKACIEGFELEVSRCNAQRKVLEQALKAFEKLRTWHIDKDVNREIETTPKAVTAAITAIEEQLK